MERDTQTVPKLLIVLLAAIDTMGILFWMIMLFFAAFMGGSPGPGHERMVPAYYVAMVALGLLAAVIDLVMVLKEKKPGTKWLLILSVVLAACGSVPFLLMELEVVFAVALSAGVLPALLHLLLLKKYTG